MTNENEQVAVEETETAAATPTVKVIEVSNPSTEEMTAISESIKVNYDFDVDVKPVNFNFKKSKDKDTGLIIDRKSVQLAIPYPSVQGIVAILEAGGKELELLLDAAYTVVNTEARNILGDDTTLNAANFPIDKISWKAISEIPKAQRRGGGIPKETWDNFAQDYCEVMPAVTGKLPKQVANAAKILQNKFANSKTNKPVLEVLVEQLAIYAENSPNVEEYQECIEFLLGKAETFLNISDEQLLANL